MLRFFYKRELLRFSRSVLWQAPVLCGISSQLSHGSFLCPVILFQRPGMITSLWGQPADIQSLAIPLYRQLLICLRLSFVWDAKPTEADFLIPITGCIELAPPSAPPTRKHLTSASVEQSCSNIPRIDTLPTGSRTTSLLCFPGALTLPRGYEKTALRPPVHPELPHMPPCCLSQDAL